MKFRPTIWLAALLIAAPAFAQDTARAWHDLAAADAAAALQLIADNHPGAAPELGDKAFQARLALARKHVAERLPKVASFGGYNALMNGLAAEFGDGHIRANPQVQVRARQWAGIVPVRQGGRWIVGLHEPAAGAPDLTGAELVACDGEPFDAWARARIGQFGGDPKMEAVLISRAPGLLLDDGNPFLARPVACSVRSGSGAPQALALGWRAIPQAELEQKVGKVLKFPAPGMGVAPFAGGYWISLETLSPAAAKVVQAVQEQQAALLAAPMVVIDMRGNGGGASRYADQIATVLQGQARMNALDSGPADCGGQYWRATPANLDNMKGARDQAARRGDTETASWYNGFIEEMEKSLAAHQSFAPALPACAAGVARQPDNSIIPPSIAPAMKGRLVVLTDHSCFSSCLIATLHLRRLGALHVGEATDMGNRYMEVRQITLPSGMRTFSTLQKVSLSSSDFGPYEPQLVYPGDLSDDQALKAWVAALPRA